MDIHLKKAYLQVIGEASLTPARVSLNALYENMLQERASISNKTMLAIAIGKADPRIAVKPTAKDIRIQPVENFTAQDLHELFSKLNLTLIATHKPGEEGSTSMQLITYIVEDDKKNRYPVVLGKGKGFGVRDENDVINNLNQQIADILSKNSSQFILLNINGKVEKIDGVRSTPGTPKSDFEFTLNGQPKFFISHKAGATASDYQQYGGTTCASGQNVCTNSEVEDFVQAIKTKFLNEMPPKKSVYRKIKDETLKKAALFGMNYGKEFGINNVNALYQGNLELIPTTNANEYGIKANHATFNGNLPTGPYEPILYGRFSASRGGNHGIKNLRTGILPLGKISSTTELI